MNKFTISVLIVSIIFISSCTVNKLISKQKNTAQTAYNSGDYKTALTQWEKVISGYEAKGKKADYAVYNGAGKSALAINN